MQTKEAWLGKDLEMRCWQGTWGLGTPGLPLLPPQ